MYNIINFHHDLMFYLIVIAWVVLWLVEVFALIFQRRTPQSLDASVPLGITHHKWLEIIWTVIPALTLYIIAIPSFSLLYSTDENNEMLPVHTIKITGYQWYWNYELDTQFSLNDHSGLNTYFQQLGILPTVSNLLVNINFDSVTRLIEDLATPELRLLTVDNILVLPVNTVLRLLITAEDVIHSWAVPAFGIKLDAVPGRLNAVYLSIDVCTHAFGQCSEICGEYHNAMPIEVQSVLPHQFLAWVLLVTNTEFFNQ